MPKLPLKISTKEKTVTVEMNADKFEKLAISFGFFSDDFISSVEKGEKEIKQGKVKKIKSLKDLRS